MDSNGFESESHEHQVPIGHPSQAEGEDPDRADGGSDTAPADHPSQAEGEDPDAQRQSAPRPHGLPPTEDAEGYPIENPSG